MKKFFPLMLTSAICLLTAQPVLAQELSDAQKKAVNGLIESYVKEHPGVIMDALEQYQRDQMAKAQESQEQALKSSLDAFNDPNLPIAGNPDGDIRVVEFFDYNCGYCKRALQDLQVMLEADKNVKVVLIDMPILGPDSLTASKWAVASQKQGPGKYFDYHRAIMAHNGPKNDTVMETLGKAAGLDVAKLKVDAQSEETMAQINKNIQQAQAIGIQGTPGFIIGEKLYRGYISYDDMKAVIQEIRAGDL